MRLPCRMNPDEEPRQPRKKGRMNKLRILVVDDHDFMRRGISSLVESHPGWTVCGEASTGNEAVAKATKLKPDIVILDISMPGLNGLEAAAQIRQSSAKTEILILSVHHSDRLIQEIVRAGIRAYVLKSDAEHDLELAVEALAKHKVFFTARATDVILKYMRPSRASNSRVGTEGLLTSREREILVLVAQGKVSGKIAAQLGIVLKTVEAHRTNLMRKLGLQGVTDLVKYALRNGIIEA
jgi:DNA-binding NarL/FixJ family response regulator